MEPELRDKARLWDMLDAARAVVGFSRGKRFPDYLADRMFRNAVERNLEIIGEAARCLSAEFRQAHPDISWGAIIAQRNVLSHEYGDIRHERVWAVCESDLPRLISFLERLNVE